MGLRRRVREDELRTEAVELLAEFPVDAALARGQLVALPDFQRRLAQEFGAAEAAGRHFSRIVAERGGTGSDGATLRRYLSRRERAEADAALTRSLDACAAAIVLRSWRNEHHEAVKDRVAYVNGLEKPTIDVEMLLEMSAAARRLRRELRGD